MSTRTIPKAEGKLISWVEMCIAVGVVVWSVTSYYVGSEIAANRANTDEKFHTISLALANIRHDTSGLHELKLEVRELDEDVDEIKLVLAAITAEK